MLPPRAIRSLTLFAPEHRASSWGLGPKNPIDQARDPLTLTKSGQRQPNLAGRPTIAGHLIAPIERARVEGVGLERVAGFG